MKTEQEIHQELERISKDDCTAINSAKKALLRWILGPTPPEKAVAFACPKCGSSILKIEPCSGYFSYTIDKYTGEVTYHNNDFNSESTDDPWYECERCHWKADGKWTDWYAKERPTEGDEEDPD